eukprot:scaffold46035_cov65-Phaeocystis_antarctica.AAC.3
MNGSRSKRMSVARLEGAEQPLSNGACVCAWQAPRYASRWVGSRCACCSRCGGLEQRRDPGG